MLPNGTIQAEHLWKRFRADRQRMLLRDELDYLMRIRKSDRASRHRWVLRDATINAQPGESIGLIGINGSGKSTLLKLLTRVMYPHSGRVNVAGRVGALIEVRAGIQPDLTGRENIFMYGALLGLTRRDVVRRFEEIVEFAELTDAVERQAKFYSSGMQMRLGFAVAAFLEPDVLLVDEVLAVGDASFQQKCLDRMRAVLASGTTLVLVSHDLAAVEATCSRAMWLDNGLIQSDGPARQVVDLYRDAIEETAACQSPTDSVVRLVKAQAGGPDGAIARTSDSLSVSIVLRAPWSIAANLVVGVSQGTASPIFLLRRDLNLTTGETEVNCEIEHLPLPGGRYYVWVGVFDRQVDVLPWHPTVRFDVSGPKQQDVPKAIVRQSPIHVDARWEAHAK